MRLGCHVNPTWPRAAADGDLISKFLMIFSRQRRSTVMPAQCRGPGRRNTKM
jgi:hypothetical protein